MLATTLVNDKKNYGLSPFGFSGQAGKEFLVSASFLLVNS